MTTVHDSIVLAGVVAGCVFVLYLVGKATKFLLKALAFLILLLLVGAAVWWFFLGGREEYQQRRLREGHPVTLEAARSRGLETVVVTVQ